MRPERALRTRAARNKSATLSVFTIDRHRPIDWRQLGRGKEWWNDATVDGVGARGRECGGAGGADDQPRGSVAQPGRAMEQDAVVDCPYAWCPAGDGASNAKLCDVACGHLRRRQ